MSFLQYPQNLVSSESLSLGNIHISTQLHRLVNNIRTSCFVMVSNGSVQILNGSFLWVIYGMRSKQYLTGHNTFAGEHSDLSTFWTKACSYPGVVLALKAILIVFLTLSSSHITSERHIDNLRVVRRSQDTPFSIQKYLQADWGIMHEAYKVRLSLPATITMIEVWSHQDGTTFDRKFLSLPTHFNIVADSRTHKAYKNRPHFQQTPPLPFTQATWF